MPQRLQTRIVNIEDKGSAPPRSRSGPPRVVWVPCWAVTTSRPMKRHFVPLAVALLFLMDGPQAAPFFYSEAVSGDLTAQSPVTFTAGAGANTLQGTVGFRSLEEEAPNYIGDRDPFSLYLGPGITITSVTLTLRPVYGTVSGAEWLVVRNGDFSDVAADFRQSNDVTVYTQTWTTNLSDATFFFQPATLGGNFDSSWSYEFTFNAVEEATSSVPEPMAAALVLVGLAGVGVSRTFRRGRPLGRLLGQEAKHHESEEATSATGLICRPGHS